MSDSIPPIPDVPSGLKEAAVRGVLIPFVGAGASLLAGCPSWKDFADSVLLQLVAHGKVTHSHLAQISNLNPRVKLSIAKILLEDHMLKPDYRSILQKNSDWRDDAKGRDLYRSLSKLSTRFVTTNYDEWLDDFIDDTFAPTLSTTNEASSSGEIIIKRESFYNPIEFTAANLSKPHTVIHLHGSLKDEAGMILTTQDYVKHYANDRKSGDAEAENRVLTFLEHLFQEKTVLFVGYGLEELEILEYVILKARQDKKGTALEGKHYLLQGFFSHEKELMESLKRYYLTECGIVLLPFLRDHNNYDQLLMVLEDFARQIPSVAEPMLLQDFKEMAALLK